MFLTVSDADMIESKILACLARSFFQVRDVLDIFLFQDALRPDSPVRLSQKLSKLALPPAEAIERLNRLANNRTVHVRGIERLLDEQVKPAVTANLRAAGGAAMIWDSVDASAPRNSCQSQGVVIVRANAWRKYLEEQRDRHGKVLFTVTELANVACASPAALNVELARLRRQEIIVRYAHGLYGMPGAVSPQVLVPAIDSHAYITGHYALYGYQMVTQMPVTITCFTDRRSPRAQQRVTPVGRLVFVCVRATCTCRCPKGQLRLRHKRFATMSIFRVATEPSRRPWSRSEISRGFDAADLASDSREVPSERAEARTAIIAPGMARG